MKKKYQLKWYSYGLTQECSRNFFTLIGAYIYACYITKTQCTKITISEIY